MSESSSREAEPADETCDVVDRFREDLRFDSYFGEALNEEIHEAVLRSARAFEEANDVNIPDEEISGVASDLLNATHEALENKTTGNY